MMRRTPFSSRAGVIAAIALIVAGSYAPAAAQVVCGSVITGSATMDADLTCAQDPALTIDSGTLNMAGHSVTCLNPNVTDGVLLLGTGSKLSNGSVSDCGVGVRLAGTGKHKLTNLVVKDGAGGFTGTTGGNKFTNTYALHNGSGYSLTGTGANKFTRAVAYLNFGGPGFEVSSEATVSDCTAINNGGGGFYMSGTKSTLSRNIAVQNGVAEFAISPTAPSSTFKLSRNTAEGSDAFVLSGSGKAIKNTATGGRCFHAVSSAQEISFTGNRALGCSIGFFAEAPNISFSKCSAVGNGAGFHFSDAGSVAGGSVKSSWALDNGGEGISLVSSGVVVSGNVALVSGGTDLYDETVNCAGNVWSDNIFNTSFDGGANCIE